MEDKEVIMVEGLSKTFGRVKAVDNLDFVVNEGDIFGFLGPNGAGKTTTLYMLLGLVRPDAGSIKILGKNLFTRRNEVIPKVGAVVESPDFYGHLSARTNLKMLRRITIPEPAPRRINDVLDLVGLTERADDKVNAFSQGMRQRLGIAQAILHLPSILILDEPTVGLDPEGSFEIWNILRDLVREFKMTIMVSSHLLYEVEEVCNRVCVIDKGKLLVSDYTTNLLRYTDPEIELEFDSSAMEVKAREELKELSWCRIRGGVETGGLNVLRIKLVNKSPRELNEFLISKGIIPTFVRPIRMNLREFYLRLTQKNSLSPETD